MNIRVRLRVRVRKRSCFEPGEQNVYVYGYVYVNEQNVYVYGYVYVYLFEILLLKDVHVYLSELEFSCSREQLRFRTRIRKIYYCFGNHVYVHVLGQSSFARVYVHVNIYVYVLDGSLLVNTCT
ncbi:hypothetical protein EI42_02878 [Thermosporothrix hazakensis]|uniref:Uncharacterized protein n=1 Tax=Thermosporothrix hazakensis TaxID=644383 RepID=A0A326U7T8_THEHA|nr:hypothetical protein EI42_02878 [Thermosporothrix hazakensis]